MTEPGSSPATRDPAVQDTAPPMWRRVIARIPWSRLRPFWPVYAVAAAISTIVLVRLRSGLHPYGNWGAQYIEHAERMTVMGAWSRRGDPGSLGLVDELDGLFPPLMHLVTLVMGVFVGHSAEHVAWTGLVWLFGLAAAVGATAWYVSRDRRAAGAAAIATLLLPAAHGFATRYYYDLPMTAVLWAMIPVALATWDRRPVVGGLAVGGIWLAADLIKWSSLSFGFFMLVAVALTPARGADGARLFNPLKRLVALVICGAVSGLGTLAWVVLGGPDGSLGVMLDMMWAGLGGASVGADGGGVGGLIDGARTWLSERAGGEPVDRFPDGKLKWYLVQSVTTVLSPLYAIALAPLALIGFARRPSVLPLLVLMVAGHVIYVVGWIPVIDDRFLLTSIPTVGLFAALGWVHLPRRIGVVTGAAVVVCGLWVASEFHLGVPPLPSASWERLPTETWDGPPMRGWGVAMGDSEQQRGWTRKDTTLPDRRATRERLWARVEACGALMVFMPPADAGARPAGDFYWLDYRSMLAARGGGPLLDFEVECNEAHRADFAILDAPKDGPANGSECLGGDFAELERIPIEGTDWELALWRPTSARPCQSSRTTR